MKTYYTTVLMLMLATAIVHANELPKFAERVATAKDIELQEPTQQYLQNAFYPVAGPVMSKAMRDCTNSQDANTKGFVIVADITQEGSLTRIDFEPKTNTAECFTRALVEVHVPMPPTCSSGALPIVIEMEITP